MPDPPDPAGQVQIRSMDRGLAGGRCSAPPSARRWNRPPPCTSSPSEVPTGSPSTTTTFPFGSTAAECDSHLKPFRQALDETGLAVPMVTTDLFSHPVFRDGGFTNNDREARRLAIRKAADAMDIATSLGRDVRRVGASGRGPSRVPRRTCGMRWTVQGGVQRPRAVHPRPRLRFRVAIEPKPNEPRRDILLPTIGHALAFINELAHPELVGFSSCRRPPRGPGTRTHAFKSALPMSNPAHRSNTCPSQPLPRPRRSGHPGKR